MITFISSVTQSYSHFYFLFDRLAFYFYGKSPDLIYFSHGTVNGITKVHKSPERSISFINSKSVYRLSKVVRDELMLCVTVNFFL